MIVTKLWFVAWFLDFYDKNAILLKEAGSTRFQNLQDRFGNILRIAPLVDRPGNMVSRYLYVVPFLVWSIVAKSM